MVRSRRRPDARRWLFGWRIDVVADRPNTDADADTGTYAHDTVDAEQLHCGIHRVRG
jgi:hypothetical protein